MSMVEDQHLSHVAPLVLRRPGGAAARVWPAALTSTGLGWTGSGRCSRIGDAGLEVGDAAVLEAEVGAGGLEPLVERSVVGRELTDPLLECGVLGGNPLDGFLCPLGLQVPDLAEEFTSAGPLGDDLAVSRFEGALCLPE
ncbi:MULTISPECIES: hypothetical protein [unclassified Streptomyces]|uniref:hypothetical protein n=1 Tax=unclassified Streptomyces TaxID=2593676 RepID=UPI0013145F5C|nr:MULTISPECIES: hypothetical protein [unclassified Streptomyces]MYR73710.1 hypothetical protein [Streptomyces sp. SID4925]